jgi:hypothetical protein
VKELLLIALLNAADAATACEGFRRGGVHDLNPLIRSCRSAIAVKSATTSVSLWAVTRVPKSRRKWLTVIAITPSAVGITFNLRAIRSR